MLAVVMLSGCATLGAVSQASEDHGCDFDRIQIIDEGARSATLDVCGQERHYRDLGHGIPNWLDVTALIETPSPVRTPVVHNFPDHTPAPKNADCSPADRADMVAAGVSASAIASACDKP